MSSAIPGAAILESKLFPATGTGKPVARPRLDSSPEALDGRRPIVVVAAPAGYGKSTLMARWYAQLTEHQIPCGWLSLDEGDDDIVRFTRHLVAAFQRLEKRIGNSVLVQLSGDFAAGPRSVLESLAGDLAQVQHRSVLFLDDLHLVQQKDVIEIVDWLVNYAPRSIQFVIGSREEPHLRLAGLRVRRELFEVGFRDLQFGVEDAARFLLDRLGFDLPGEQVQQLVMKTEGWPAALELAALALSGATDHAELIEQFAGTDDNLVDYLGEVVLARLDERTRSFVSRLALFDRISAPLAQAITAVEDSEQLLKTLRARNLFLIALDRSGTWLRFHHLVGQFFRERYLAQAPSDARDCLIRGACWLHDARYTEEAINCAIRAQDWERATAWVAANVEELILRRGYHQTILRWMSLPPEEWVDRYPVIRIQFAFALSFYPRRQEHEAQLHRLQRLLARLQAQADADPQQIDELRCAVEMQVAMSVGLRDDGRRGGELAAEWLARWPQAPLLRKGIMGNVLGFGCKASGEIARGMEVLGIARQLLEQGEGYYALAWTGYLEALLYLERGSYLDAKSTCIAGLAQIERNLNGHPAHASLFQTLLAAVAYEFDEIEDAARHVERAMTSVDEYGHADAVILAFLTRARLAMVRQEENDALAVLRDGQELATRRELHRVRVTLAAEECTWLCRAGRYEEGRVLAARFGFSELPAQDSATGLAIDKAFRAAARIALRASPGAVICALDGGIEYCRTRELYRGQVELLLLRALANQSEGNAGRAMEDLHKALTLAAPRQYLRVFLDEAAGLRSLVEQLDPAGLRGSEAAPLARRLAQRLTRPEHVAAAKMEGAPALIEELTRRERAILRHLQSGLDGKEIASAIFISEGTLKWHLHNIYGKLDVKNRSGAIARAREMGMI
jgi:ATP/maltotriose-dependent transcriptional regulator MalT